MQTVKDPIFKPNSLFFTLCQNGYGTSRGKERQKSADSYYPKMQSCHGMTGDVEGKSGEGELIVVWRPNDEEADNDFLPCSYCYGVCRTKALWRHIKKCNSSCQRVLKVGQVL